jgi:hypothetical protein
MPKNHNDMVAALGSRRQHFARDDVLQRLRELREAREREEREPVFRDDPEPVSQFMPGPETEQALYDANVDPGYGMNWLQRASLPLSAFPVVGDVAGLAGDAQMYYENPESRNWMNYVLSAAGALPFVPSAAGAVKNRAARLEKAAKSKKAAKAGAAKHRAARLEKAAKSKKAAQVPSAVGSVGRTSKAQAVAQGLFHPIGKGKKLPMPVDDMQFQQQVVKDLPPRTIIRPEDLQGSMLIPATGDRTSAGKNLTSVGGLELESPVYLEGGPDFMRTHLDNVNPEQSAAWASAQGVATSLSNRARAAADKGVDASMVYTPMGHSSGDFSVMMSDAVLAQTKVGKIPKRVRKEFDYTLRKVRPEWKGLDNPASRAQLESNGALRLAFLDVAGLTKFNEAGFPDLAVTRAAIMEPALMDVPMHAGGFSIARMDPEGRVIKNPSVPHKTYDTQLAGQYMGGFDVPVPREVLFPKFTAGRRKAGGDPSRDHRAFQLSHPAEMADQQWLDGVMKYRRGLL